MQAIHGVTVVYARNSFIAFIAALLAIDNARILAHFRIPALT